MSKKPSNKINIDEKITSAMGSMKSIIFHTVLFVVFLCLPFFTEINFDSALLILTTIVSLEAIYLALFIQISINRQAQALDEVSDDIEDIQEDVDNIHEHVEDVSEDVEELNKSVDEIQEDVEEINQSVDEIEKDVEEIAEDVEDIQEEVDDEHPENVSEEAREEKRKKEQKEKLDHLEKMMQQIVLEIKDIKK
jgi:uncharacterized protein YoxC